MQIYRGERRLFETYIAEENDTTSTARHILIPGITSYDELTGSVIPIKAYIDGTSGATTITINNLQPVNLKLYYNSSVPESPHHSWIKTGQVYNIVYTGTYFTTVGIVPSTADSYTFDIANDIAAGTISSGDDITSSVSVNMFNSIKVGDILLITDINNPINNTAISKNIIYMCEEFIYYYYNNNSCTVKLIECLYGTYTICSNGISVYYGTNPPIPQN